MIKVKIPKFFKSFRGKTITLIALVIVTALLYLSIFYLPNRPSHPENSDNGENITDSTEDSSNRNIPRVTGQIIDSGIDSVLSDFGIKKEWITTYYNPAYMKTDAKHIAKDAGWLTKTVLIPIDLNSIEINADISNYLNSLGIKTAVTEDIVTKDIVITASQSDAVSSAIPLAKFTISHSDKVTRESALFCLILDKIGDYKNEEIEKFLIGKTEFSYIFPKSLDDIDVQNKLLQNKKDVIINLTIGSKDNYDADFSTNLDEKNIRDKVKTFSSDFPTIRTVVLTRTEQNIPQSGVSRIVEEFNKFNINVIDESDLTRVLTPAEEESKEKPVIIGANLRSKAGTSKSLVTMLRINPDEFEKFFDEVLKLKKLGYKFCNYAEYNARKTELEKKERLKKEEQQKILTDKKLSEKKKSEQKKVKDKKPVEKKKTETKKPNTNDKKKK